MICVYDTDISCTVLVCVYIYLLIYEWVDIVLEGCQHYVVIVFMTYYVDGLWDNSCASLYKLIECCINLIHGRIVSHMQQWQFYDVVTHRNGLYEVSELDSEPGGWHHRRWKLKAQLPIPIYSREGCHESRGLCVGIRVCVCV